MRTWKNIVGLWLCFIFLSLVPLHTLNRISKVNYEQKLRYLDHKLASSISMDEDEEKCEYRTYVRCKNYINATQWHWAEIITLNSCDQKISYSTADQEHFARLRRGLIRRGKSLGSRSYENLDFEVYQNKKGQIMEFNEHLNKQGKMFYLVNIIRN